MKPVTQKTVLEFLGSNPVRWNDLLYHFVLDEERQYLRLEKILEKLHSQKKIEVIKEMSFGDVVFGDHKGSMFRVYKFKCVS